MAADYEAAARLFRSASEYAHASTIKAEIQWQRETKWEAFSESQLLREAAWVIACSGFREATVRKIFDYLSLCFCEWESAESIVTNAPWSKGAARSVFKHDGKLNAMEGVARRIKKFGFATLKSAILRDPLVELRKFDYIGPITCWHLAKNLGFNSAKPDRHLVRLSVRLGFDSVFVFCNTLASAFGEEPKVVDLILWRFLADNPSVRREWA